MIIKKQEVVLSVRLTAALRNTVNEAAARTGLTTMDWIRAVLARAANEGAFAPRQKGGSRASRKNP